MIDDELDSYLPSRLGKYDVLHRLAVGGMAEILLARSEGIEGFVKHVVIKRILPQYSREHRFVTMFLDEARLAACLHHQNIAQVYDIGQEDHEYFFAMEYVHGEDLRRILQVLQDRGESIPLAHALTVFVGVASGLAYAHEQITEDGTPLGIVHRDVSPHNILVSYDGGVKLVDFGIARATIRTSETRTGGGVKGKLSYMSPEQCLGEDLDHRSDLFSLGTVLYELTTMSKPFRRTEDDSDYIVMNRIVQGEVPLPRQLRPDYPPELEAIVMKALRRNPDERYQNVRDMLDEVEQFSGKHSQVLSSSGLASYLIGIFGRKPEPWQRSVRIQLPIMPAPGDGSDAGLKGQGRPATGGRTPSSRPATGGGRTPSASGRMPAGGGRTPTGGQAPAGQKDTGRGPAMGAPLAEWGAEPYESALAQQAKPGKGRMLFAGLAIIAVLIIVGAVVADAVRPRSPAQAPTNANEPANALERPRGRAHVSEPAFVPAAGDGRSQDAVTDSGADATPGASAQTSSDGSSGAKGAFLNDAGMSPAPGPQTRQPLQPPKRAVPPKPKQQQPSDPVKQLIETKW